MTASPSSLPPAIVASGLAIGYRGRPVVSDLDLDLDGGDLLALVGTNGSGKSTLLKTIAGLLRPLGGELQVLGDAPGHQPRRLGYLPQSHATGSVLPLRVRDVVRTARFADRGLIGRLTADDESLVDQALRRMGVAALAQRSLDELSGGQRQRVHLAHVLARRADLLVLDEPTAGIDLVGRQHYEQAIADERARGAAVVVATHDIGEAERATEVVLLAGRVVAQGPPAQVLTAEHLLDAFGIGLRRVGDALLAGEAPHAHEHGAGEAGDHGHPLGPRDAGRRSPRAR